MRIKLVAVLAAAAFAVPASSASAVSATEVANPIPPCLQTVIANLPGFTLSTVRNLVENGQLPRLMGPWLPC